MLIDTYNELYSKVKALTDSISSAESKISGAGTPRDIEIRINTLEESLKKIDDYTPRVDAFRIMAEKHLKSKNLLTIEAPPGYRVNLNRLRMWAMLIDPMTIEDPTASDDPYAQRVYMTAKCDECFLEKKKNEFTQRIADLKGDDKTAISAETDEQKAKIAEVQANLSKLASSAEVINFAKLVAEENIAQFYDGKYSGKGYWYEIAPESYVNVAKRADSIALGAISKPLGFPEEQRPHLKQLFGELYREIGGRVLLPAEMPTDKEFAVSITCTPARTKALDRGLQNFILNIINKFPAGENKVYLIDAVRFNSTALGSLKQLEDSSTEDTSAKDTFFPIERLPRNPEQMNALLEKLVSNFADMDDILGMYDSVLEYNVNAEPEKQLPRATLILFGWPNAFEGSDREYVQRIMTNYERYGISFISVSFTAGDKESQIKKSLPEYAAHSATYINMTPKETTVCTGDETPQNFIWYFLKSELPTAFIEALRAVKIAKKSLGSEYGKRYDLRELPTYTREYKMLELPFGVDAKDQAHSMSFERENFAAYLVGASGSGKSTLLHTLISGVIRNFHPDNVELWLADFKQLEFKEYIKHCPPHVKYILLDESTELVYDLIDRIYDKMMERQRLFPSIKDREGKIGISRLDQADPRDLAEPMPLIFIILDEFSVMSQSISESPVYKLKLQNVLAKGRALGIRFLFASQTFTKGIAGLTPTAKDQIQQRISMKGTREEISETLELSANLKTDQVNNWMDALPPYYALVKHRTGADTPPEVKRVNVMWFPDYSQRDEMIDRRNESMLVAERYDPSDVNTYVDKKPITVDGNTYDAFDNQSFINHVDGIRNKSSDYSSDDVFVSFGTPRLMEKIKTALLTPETRENMLLIGRDVEQICTAAVITSSMKSFLAQERKVTVWAYNKNRLYKAYRGKPWGEADLSALRFVDGIDDVCDAIRAMKQNIQCRKNSNELIILVGMDRICADFELIDAGTSSPGINVEKAHGDNLKEREQEAIRTGAVAATDYEEAYDEWCEKQFLAWSKATEEAAAAGMAEDEINKAGEDANKEFAESNPEPRKEDFLNTKEDVYIPTEPKEEKKELREKDSTTKGAYNAIEDFQYIVKQGSRLGYHFMLCLNAFADLRTTTLKLDLFRHRLAFQVSIDDSRELFGNRNASELPEHICQYFDTMESFSFRPYMHDNMTWDGWEINDEGKAVNPYEVFE